MYQLKSLKLTAVYSRYRRQQFINLTLTLAIIKIKSTILSNLNTKCRL